MSPPATRVVQGVLAGTGVTVMQLWPSIAAWWAGQSGSAGDLSENPILAVGVLWALVLGIMAGRIMVRLLANTPKDPNAGRLDPWAAYALGVGTYGLAITALYAITLGLLLTDENQSLRSREWLVLLGWAAGHVVAALAAYRATTAVLPAGVLSAADHADSD